MVPGSSEPGIPAAAMRRKGKRRGGQNQLLLLVGRSTASPAPKGPGADSDD